MCFSVAPRGWAGEHPLRAIWLAPVDASEPARRMTAGTADDRAPAWLGPDELLFLSDRAERGTAQLQRLSLRGGEAEAVTSWAPGVAGFAVLTGKRWVALLARDPGDEPDPWVEGRERPD